MAASGISSDGPLGADVGSTGEGGGRIGIADLKPAPRQVAASRLQHRAVVAAVLSIGDDRTAGEQRLVVGEVHPGGGDRDPVVEP
jgi:hypothetical protein